MTVRLKDQTPEQREAYLRSKEQQKLRQRWQTVHRLFEKLCDQRGVPR